MNTKSLFIAAALLTNTLFVVAQQTPKKELTLADIWQKGTFNQKSVNGFRSLNNGRDYAAVVTDEAGNKNILKYSFTTGTIIDTILRARDLVVNGKTIVMDDYSMSTDESKILIATQQEAIYRRSTKEYNYIYNRQTKKTIPLCDKAGSKEKYACFSPNGNMVAFVRDNNLFIKDLNNAGEIQVTKDGEQNKIINGGTDWVYEEEFEFARAFFWSPDGNSIAYYKFNETAVKEFHMPIYDGLYPTDYTYKYPKAGEANSIVSIYAYNLINNGNIKMDVGPETDQYIPRIKWMKKTNQLCVLRMNRLQNKLDYLVANSLTGMTKLMMTEKSDTYVEVNDDLFFLDKSFIITSERGGYRHLYQFNYEGQRVGQITKGKWDVTSIYGIDEENRRIYYQSAENSPMQRDVYVCDLSGNNKRKLSAVSGTNSAVFTSNFSYFINYHTGAGDPLTVTLLDKNAKLIRVLENNAKLRNTLKEYSISKKEFFSLNTSDDVSLNGWMIKPTNFDPTKKYPVFMFVYGGPGSQTVTYSWGGNNDMWYHLLASKGYIVVSVDGRGTGARGTAFKNCTYLNLGNKELTDQMEAAKWLAKQSYVDGTRIGLQGWSFGGYMASLCATKGADVFKMTIAVAPVTNWRFYDSIYTERFLRTPQENANGYDNNSPINFADKMKRPYLLIHGTADDNVHFQNAAEMATELIKNNKKFDSQFYPDKNHGIYGGNTRLHLYTKMTDFIQENL